MKVFTLSSLMPLLRLIVSLLTITALEASCQVVKR